MMCLVARGVGDGVDALISPHLIRAQTAIKRVVTFGAAEHVHTAVADDAIVTRAAHGVFEITGEGVLFATAGVPARAATVDAHGHAVGAILIRDGIERAAASAGEIIAEAREDAIAIARAAAERIVAVFAVEVVIARIAVDGVVARATMAQCRCGSIR